MVSKTLTEAQIEKSTTEFVEDFCKVKDSEISSIIAGLTAIIEGNESAMKRMKEQKWFQRIWFTLTGKNRAEVADMKAKRDELSKYTIRLLVKMNQKIGDHAVLINDLYRSLSIVRNDVNDLQSVVDSLARKLNEKIISVDNYNNIITDIQNGCFDPNKALISLIEVMSLIDRRTANDISKLDRIRQTMEKNGFDFASKINVQQYAEDVFSLPEDKVGSIYLFCQSCSTVSKYLAYTCRLIENYFYVGETDRREALESREAINNAIIWSGLRDSSDCVVSAMYSDLKDAVETQAKESDTVCKGYSKKIVVAGVIGSGKTTFINEMSNKIGDRLNYSGCKGHYVQSIGQNTNTTWFEITGFDISNENVSKAQRTFDSLVQDGVTDFIYCISCVSSRIEEAEENFINYIQGTYPDVNVLVLLTLCLDKEQDDFIQKVNTRLDGTKIIPIMAKDYVFRGGAIASYGLDGVHKYLFEV